MKLKVPKNTLDKAIKAVCKAVPNKGIQPILNNILLENEDGHLVLNATDLDFFIEAKVPSNNEESGSITLSAKKLEEIVSKLEEDDVSINVDYESHKASLICKKANFDLIGLSPEDFPKMKKPDPSEMYTINSNALSKAIDMVHFAASRYDVNNVLGGVYMSIENGILELAATDGNRLASYEIELEDKNGTLVKKEAVIPVKVVADVQKIIESSVDENVKVAFTNNQVMFKTEDRLVISRLLEGTYPRFKQLIPDEFEKIAQVDRKDLLSCLERVAVMANERTNLVRLSFNDNQLKINSSNLDFGGAEDDLEIEYMGDEMDIHFNVKYLIDGIRTLDSDKVQFGMNAPLNPVVVKPISDSKYIYLIMPIKHK